MRHRTPFLALALAFLASGPPAGADEPRLNLSWRAPYGMPRASDTLSFACGDTTGRDTLYLTYETGRNSGFFVGLEASLYFRAQPGDSLERFWHLDQRSGSVFVDFSNDSIPGAARALRTARVSTGAFYDRTRGSGRLRLQHVGSIDEPMAVRDSTQYFLARLIFSRPRERRACSRPICIEWGSADLALDSTFVTQAGRSGRRFVSWSSAKACDDFRPKGPAPWKPKAPGAGGR